MATLVSKGHFTTKLITKNNGVGGVLYVKSASYATSDASPHNLAAYKRGTGGRSSFNGIVATVFGCTGFVGRYVCNKLGKTGTQIICPYRTDFYDAQRLKVCGDLGQVLFTPFDIRDEESIAKAVRYSNVVINLVGRDYETKNFSYMDVHANGPRRLAKISREMGVKRFIHLSYLNQSKEPRPLILSKPSKYQISKQYGEEAVREEFPTATIIRCSDIYGSEDRFTRVYGSSWRINADYLPVYRSGLETVKQPVFVSDVAQGIVNAMLDDDTRCNVYQAVGPDRYLLADMLDWFYKLMRKNHKRYDLKMCPVFPFKIPFNALISPSYPLGGLHWEALEKEATTDVVDKDLPTLLDLGVTPTPMEHQIPWLMKAFRKHAYYEEQVGEFPKPDPPQPVYY